MLPTIAREGDVVVMIDQRKLPVAGSLRPLQDRAGGRARHQDDGDSRRAGDRRGGGHGASRSACAGARRPARRSSPPSSRRLCELMAATRPTAVNLFWAIDRMKRVVRDRRRRPASRSTRSRIGSTARRSAIHDEDVASCRAMGAFGAAVVPADARILTHCNAGALATAGYGTALGVIRGAVEAGKHVAGVRRRDAAVPAGRAADRLGAGARRHRHDGHHRQHERRADARRAGSNFVVVGADRIAANGDTANKIGTYGVAVLAREHDIPFYVAAPLSTIDLRTPDGAHIPIEERNAREVTHVGGVAGRAGRRAGLESGVRRDAAPLHRRHHHRARHLPGAVRRVAEEAFERRRQLARKPSRAERASGSVCHAALCDPRHRNLLRRDVRRRRRRDRRRGDGPGRSARTSSRRRWRSIASGAASCPSSRRASTSATSAASSSARWPTRRLDLARPRRDRRHAGPRPRRVAARRRVVREGRGRRGGPAARRRAPSGRPHRIARAAERRAAAAVGRARRLRRPHQPVSRRAPGALPAAQPHARRCGGRGVRQGGEAARPRLSGRAGHRSAGEDRQRSRGRAADDAADARGSQRAGAEGRSRLQLQRPEDRGAAPRAASGRRRRPLLRRRRSPTSAPASSASSSDALVERAVRRGAALRREERRRRRRRVGQQPAARRPEGARRARARCRRFCRAWRSRPTTPR